MQLINHGVSSSLIEKLKQEIPEFFKLPMEEKKKYWQQPGDVEGYGQAFVMSEETKLDWSDMFYMSTLPTYLRKPHLFPKLPLPLRFLLLPLRVCLLICSQLMCWKVKLVLFYMLL